MSKRKYAYISEVEELEKIINELKEKIESNKSVDGKVDLSDVYEKIEKIENKVKEIESKILEIVNTHKHEKHSRHNSISVEPLNFAGKKVKIYDKISDSFRELIQSKTVTLVSTLIHYFPNEFPGTEIKLVDQFENKIELVGYDDSFIKLSSRGKPIKITSGTKMLIVKK